MNFVWIRCGFANWKGCSLRSQLVMRLFEWFWSTVMLFEFSRQKKSKIYFFLKIDTHNVVKWDFLVIFNPKILNYQNENRKEKFFWVWVESRSLLRRESSCRLGSSFILREEPSPFPSSFLRSGDSKKMGTKVGHSRHHPPRLLLPLL